MEMITIMLIAKPRLKRLQGTKLMPDEAIAKAHLAGITSKDKDENGEIVSAAVYEWEYKGKKHKCTKYAPAAGGAAANFPIETEITINKRSGKVIVPRTKEKKIRLVLLCTVLSFASGILAGYIAWLFV